MKIRTKDGVEFEADSWVELVEGMRIASPIVLEENTIAFMRAVARRVKVWNGHVVSCRSEQKFILGLVKAELIELEDE